MAKNKRKKKPGRRTSPEFEIRFNRKAAEEAEKSEYTFLLEALEQHLNGQLSTTADPNVVLDYGPDEQATHSVYSHPGAGVTLERRLPNGDTIKIRLDMRETVLLQTWMQAHEEAENVEKGPLVEGSGVLRRLQPAALRISRLKTDVVSQKPNVPRTRKTPVAPAFLRKPLEPSVLASWADTLARWSFGTLPATMGLPVQRFLPGGHSPRLLHAEDRKPFQPLKTGTVRALDVRSLKRALHEQYVGVHLLSGMLEATGDVHNGDLIHLVCIPARVSHDQVWILPFTKAAARPLKDGTNLFDLAQATKEQLLKRERLDREVREAKRISRLPKW